MAEARESRPAGNRAATLDGDDIKFGSSVPPGADTTGKRLARVIRRKRWAQAYMDRISGKAPRYGSDEWLALPATDPRKVAGCVAAAETWIDESEHLPELLAADLDVMRQAAKVAEDEAYQQRATAHRARYRHLRVVTGTSTDEDARIAEARHPRPGDYPGRAS